MASHGTGPSFAPLRRKEYRSRRILRQESDRISPQHAYPLTTDATRKSRSPGWMASVTVPSRQPWLGGIDGSRRGLMGHSIGHHER